MSLNAMMHRSINACLEPAGFSLRRFQPEMYTQAMESLEVLEQQVIRFRETFAAACGSFNYRREATQATRTSDAVEAYVRLTNLRFVCGHSPANLTLVVLK